MHKAIALLTVLSTACAPANETEAPHPWIALGRDPQLALGVGGTLYWNAAWQGTCVRDNWGDADSSYSCDGQPIRVHITCDGVPCTVSEPEALDARGVEADGELHVNVHPQALGTITTTITMERIGTGEVATQTATAEVVAATRLEIECMFEADGQWPGVDCPKDVAPFVPGAVYLISAQAYAKGMKLDTDVRIAAEGFQLKFPNEQIAVDDIFIAPSPGDYAARAAYQGLSAEYLITLQ